MDFLFDFCDLVFAVWIEICAVYDLLEAWSDFVCFLDFQW